MSTIHIKKSHRGLLHKNLGVKQGEHIPASKLKVHEGDSPALKKRKIFAQNAKHWKHEEGGTIPKYGTGSTIGGAVGTSAGLALNLAVPGLGFVAAPVAGAIGSYVGSLFDDKPAELSEGDIKNQQVASRMLGSNSPLVNRVQTNTSSIFKEGGMNIRPNAEIERDELVQVPDGTYPKSGRGGSLNPLSNDTYNASGASHNQGGIDTALPEGTKIFSDKIKYNGRSISSHVKPISGKIGSLEKKMESNPSKAIENTINRLKQQEDYFFDLQEGIKQEKEFNKQTKSFFRNGGRLKYDDGGQNPFNPTVDPRSYGYTIDPSQSITSEDQLGMSNPVNFSRSNPTDPVTGTDLGSNSGVDIPTTSNDYSWLNNNATQLGALGTNVVGNLIQQHNINKIGAPRRMIANPIIAPTPFTKVDLSQERTDLNRDAQSARNTITQNSGSFSTQASNFGKVRAQQLLQRGNINMREQNANTQIDNSYKLARADYMNKDSMNRQIVDQYNLENKYNYDLWRTGANNKAIADLTGNATDIFNNATNNQNQLDYYDALAKGYGKTGILGRNELNPRKRSISTFKR